MVFEKVNKSHTYFIKKSQQLYFGNTEYSLCVRCVVRFFGRLHRNSAGILPYGKGFLGNMTENLQADCVQSRQAGFIQRFLYSIT